MLTKNILIIEDNPIALKSLIQIVKDCISSKEQVFGYTNCKGAVDCLKTHEISLLITDVTLGQNKENRDGIRFVEKLRESEKYRYLSVIFVNGLEDTRSHAYRDLHCIGYIEKKDQLQEFKEVVEKAMSFQPAEKTSRLHLKKDGVHVLFDTDQVEYVRIVGKQLFVKINGRPLELYGHMTMKEISQQLTQERMRNGGKGLLINERYVDHLDPKGKLLYLKNIAEPLKLSRAGYKELGDGNNFNFRGQCAGNAASCSAWAAAEYSG